MNVFDFAMDIERSGKRFYEDLAKSTDRAGLRSIFIMMAKDEQVLHDKFQAMKASLQTTAMEDSTALDRARNIFVELDVQKALERIDSDLDAYKFILEVEEKLFRLYEDAAGRETGSEVRDLLLKIAEEEHREHESIRRIYDFVNAPNEYLAWGEFSNLDEYHQFGRDEG